MLQSAAPSPEKATPPPCVKGGGGANAHGRKWQGFNSIGGDILQSAAPSPEKTTPPRVKGGGGANAG